MNSKGKGIITAVIVVLIALAAFCGFGSSGPHRGQCGAPGDLRLLRHKGRS